MATKIHRVRDRRTLCNAENDPNKRDLRTTTSPDRTTCKICLQQQAAPRPSGFRAGGKKNAYAWFSARSRV